MYVNQRGHPQPLPTNLKQFCKAIEYVINLFTSGQVGSTIKHDDADGWITVNGAPVSVEDGKLKDIIGDKIMESGENNNGGMEEHKFSSNEPEVGTLGNPSATGANPDLPGFTDKNLDKHFESGFDSDHGSQYPNFTKEQYAQMAHDLVRAAVGHNILGYKAANGDIVRFDESTNDFVKGAKNGIRTMFKPDEGTHYFERQLSRDGGTTND